MPAAKIFARRERQLVAVLRLALQERTAAIEPRAVAPCARELTVDIGDETAIGARRRQPVGRNEGVIGGRQEGRLGGGQREIGFARGRQRGGCRLRLGGFGRRGESRRGRGTGRARALQKAAPGN